MSETAVTYREWKFNRDAKRWEKTLQLKGGTVFEERYVSLEDIQEHWHGDLNLLNIPPNLLVAALNDIWERAHAEESKDREQGEPRMDTRYGWNRQEVCWKWKMDAVRNGWSRARSGEDGAIREDFVSGVQIQNHYSGNIHECGEKEREFVLQSIWEQEPGKLKPKSDDWDYAYGKAKLRYDSAKDRYLLEHTEQMEELVFTREDWEGLIQCFREPRDAARPDSFTKKDWENLAKQQREQEPFLTPEGREAILQAQRVQNQKKQEHISSLHQLLWGKKK